MLVHFTVDPRKKNQMEPLGWREKTWRERLGIIDQLDARPYTCDLKFNDLSTNDNNAELV